MRPIRDASQFSLSRFLDAVAQRRMAPMGDDSPVYPAEVEVLIALALSLDPDTRPSAAEFVDRLRAALTPDTGTAG